MREKSKLGRTDETLMAEYQKGNEDAFEELYRRYSGRVYAYLRRRLDQKEWIEDVFQMVFVKFHRARHQYDPAHRVDQWVFVMTKTVLLDFWKTTAVKTNRFFSKSTDELGEEFSGRPGEGFPNTVSPDLELAPNLPEGALSSLSSDQRKAVELKYFSELSYAEIASKMNRTEASVRQLVSRGLKMIRGALRPGGGNSS